MNHRIILTTAILLFFIQQLTAQNIATFPLPKSVTEKPRTAIPLLTKKIATPAELNTAQANRYITQFKNGNRAYLDSLLDLLRSPAVQQKKDTFYKTSLRLLVKVARAADSPALVKTIDTLPALKDSTIVVDSAAMKTAAEKQKDTVTNDTTSITDGCAGIKNVVSIHLDKNTGGEYIVSLLDSHENPLKAFTIRQFNESLVQDQLKEALSSLCTRRPLAKDDSIYIDGLVTSFGKQKLYDKMLEASLMVNDANVYAGVLKIYKRVPLVCTYYTDTAKNSTTTKGDTAQKGKTSFVRIKNGSGLQTALSWMAGVPSAEETDAIKPSDTDTLSRVKLNGNQGYRWFTVHSIQIQFQDGFIENIKVLGKMDGDTRLLKFENSYPIAFSTRRDFRKLYSKDIYERTIYATPSVKRTHNIRECSMNLGDLLFYDQQLALNSKDYSPANQVCDTLLTDTVTSINLLKEQTSKILELKVFSDLKGIDNDNPNGLVQLELSKKLNFWNNRSEWLRLFNIGFFNYLTPYFTMNKIENNNKRLTVSYQGSQQRDTLKPNTFASTVNLYQYQSFGIGANLTCVTIDIPGWKSTLNLNMGGFFGRTLLQDTARIPDKDSSTFKSAPDNNVRQFGVNSFQFSPEICWQIFPDKRYGVTISQRFIHYDLLSSEIKQVRDSISYKQYLNSLKGDRSKIDGYRAKNWLGSAEIYAFFKPSEFNQIFFRYRLNWYLDDARLNFHQIQVGISTYLTHTKKAGAEQ
ncbi:MAG: hypothetical protein J0H74_14730 [Chitinophagaceae bacterium]|nr:hypothetical protein [Chitinophagaceae bacterium]